MPLAQWPLHNDRPSIEIVLSRPGGNVVRRLIADTGAGTARSSFQFILTELDCRHSNGILMGQVQLGGAYAGRFPVYAVDVQIPALSFADTVSVVGVTRVPQGFDGIAGFRFLDRFHYGNSGNPGTFGLQ